LSSRNTFFWAWGTTNTTRAVSHHNSSSGSPLTFNSGAQNRLDQNRTTWYKHGLVGDFWIQGLGLINPWARLMLLRQTHGAGLVFSRHTLIL
jgi:hypothetical protein